MIEEFERQHKSMLERVSKEKENLNMEFAIASQVFAEVVEFVESVVPKLSFVVSVVYLNPVIMDAQVRGGRIVFHTRLPQKPCWNTDDDGLPCITLFTYGGAGVRIADKPRYCQLEGKVMLTEELPEALVRMEGKYLLGITDPTKY